MTIQEELRSELKDATRARDQARLEVIRAVETELTMARTAKGFSGEVDDALYRQVIAAYSKKMDKARAEYEGLGERGKEMAAKLAFEVEYLSRWLPKKLDEAGTLALVREAIAALGVSDPKQAGKVMGHLMKGHKEALDAGLVNRLVKEALGGAK
ncbi:MAG: GatB/YqeY domain-containing protein [Polyangia bacterium]|nr:GatB/YqeY domain-containing protein [Polyangia bacterium]